MPNGDSNDELWRVVHRLETDLLRSVSALSAEQSLLGARLSNHIEKSEQRWKEQDDRRSRVPTYIWWVVSVGLAVALKGIDWVLANAP